jgi:hypothetical protein
MAVFPVQVFTKDQVKLRWGERYTSAGLNKKFLGIPNGVYLGFTPSSVAGSNILDLTIDPAWGVSVGRVKSNLGPYGVDIVSEANVAVDFTGHTVFPVYVFITGAFRVNLETSAQITTRSTPPDGIEEIGVCRIDSLGLTPVIETGQAPDRHTPIANTGIPFGFMTDGAEQDRARAVLTSDEVDAAREDTLAFIHPLLQDRLTADFDPTRIAANQGNGIEAIRSNDHTEVTGSSLNVSHSFAAPSRTSQPAQDIGGGGSESLNGAICEVITNIDPATSDLIRNIVAIQEISSARPYVDPSTGRPVFGRLKFDEVDATAGTIPDPATTLTFTNGLDTVLRTAGLTDLDTVYSPGDLVKDPDGNYYPVLSVLPAAMTLSVPWVATTLLVTQTIQRRRFTVDFFTRNLGVETVYSVVRTCILDTGGWTGTDLGVAAPVTPEPYLVFPVGSEGGIIDPLVNGIVAQSYAPSNLLLYVPDDPAVVIGSGAQITGQTSLNIATAVFGTPTLDAPDLRFYFNVFQDISESRSNELLDYLQSPHPDIPRATEIIDGLTRFASFTGTDRNTALQAADTRIFGNIVAGQSMGLQKITDLGAPAPATNDAARIVDVEAATFPPSYATFEAIGLVGALMDWVVRAPNINSPVAWAAVAGVVTVPVGQTGIYLITATVSAFTPAATDYWSFIFRVAGVTKAASSELLQGASNGYLYVSLILPLTAGQAIDVTVTLAAGFSITAVGTSNLLSFSRIG